MLPTCLPSAWTSFLHCFLSKIDVVNVTAVALALKSLGLPRKQPSWRNSAALSSGSAGGARVRSWERELPHQWLSGEWDQMTQSPRSSAWVSPLFPISPEPPLIPSKTLAWQSPKCLISSVSSFFSFIKAGQNQSQSQELGPVKFWQGERGVSESWWLGSQPTWTLALLKSSLLHSPSCEYWSWAALGIQSPLKFHKALSDPPSAFFSKLISCHHLPYLGTVMPFLLL